jgi:hypothetical protein
VFGVGDNVEGYISKMPFITTKECLDLFAKNAPAKYAMSVSGTGANYQVSIAGHTLSLVWMVDTLHITEVGAPAVHGEPSVEIRKLIERVPPAAPFYMVSPNGNTVAWGEVAGGDIQITISGDLDNDIAERLVESFTQQLEARDLRFDPAWVTTSTTSDSRTVVLKFPSRVWVEISHRK